MHLREEPARMPVVRRIAPTTTKNRVPKGRRTDAKGAAGVRTLRFRMESRRSAVAPAVDRILEAVKGAGLSDDQFHDLAVALAEALSNAAVHGNALRPDAPVQVVVKVTPRKRAVIEVKDAGRGFDHGSLSDPTDPSRILIPGGRGVFLMRRLCDQIEFSDSGSRVRLVMDRH